VNWIELLEDNLIHYVTSGKNTGAGEISIKCPWCGEDDPSQHLGVKLTTGKWNCWRDATHRGASPYRLISALLGVSGAQARLTVQAYSGVAVDSFDAPQAVIGAPDRAIKPVAWPDEFEPLRSIFCDYLFRRGIDTSIADYYCLACCRVGRWKQRIIIPVFDKNFKLLGWQGRAIVEPKKAPRYLTSHEQVKRTVFNLQNISKGGEVLYIVEGPFDAMKIDFYGKPRIRATCSFGVTVTAEQIQILNDLCSKFSKVVLIFDSDSPGIIGGFNLSDWLPNISFGNFPEGHKDLDKMSSEQIRGFLEKGL